MNSESPRFLEELTRVPRVAYFSMEFAIRDEIPTYAGGLGVLAGDLMRSAADLGVAMVGVSLVSRHGYFRQELTADGEQVEKPDLWEPARFATHLPTSVCVTIGTREVWIDGWLMIVDSVHGGGVPVILLDTDVERNAAADRALTDALYGGDTTYRLAQEIVLGIGGVRMLRALGFSIREYHMNEGHSALLALELLRDEQARGAPPHRALQAVRLRANFTTHTPVEAAHDRFPYALVEQMLGAVDAGLLRSLGGEHDLNLTMVARETSGMVNGVTCLRSGETLFAEPIPSISNGVHSRFWTCAPMAAVFDRYIPEWTSEPELLTRAARIPAEELLAAHGQAKELLLAEVRQRTAVSLDPRMPIVAFARRMTSYKRPDLLFEDVEALRAIGRAQPFQIVVAGKAHPRDDRGKQMIRALHEYARALGSEVPTVFVPNYGLALAKLLVAGSDVWLNTPLPPLEASGTSGMKAAHNGVPSLSVRDGWWIDGWIEGVTGWAIDGEHESHAAALRAKLRDVVLPLYAAGGEPWAAVMRGAIVHNASLFNSHRMMRRYAAEVYLGAA
ncbi:MAG TPA: alpha-glucan family phosphorylase [Thermoanaerobaculia bacterium]